MAIDTTALNKLIADFRALSQKDSISPESLGSLLQRLADLLAVCTTDSEAKPLFALLGNITSLPDALMSISQGSADRNDVLVNITNANILKGTVTSLSDQIFIRQATTDRAGVMRAQQVTDLNAAKKSVANLEASFQSMATDVQTHSTRLSSLGTTVTDTQKAVSDNAKSISSLKVITDRPEIQTVVENKKLLLLNAQYYLDKGFIPFVFRKTKKRNRTRHELSPNKRGPQRKGWHVIGGSPHCVNINKSCIVAFADVPLDEWHDLYRKTFNYSQSPDALVRPCIVDDTELYVNWGKVQVSNFDRHSNSPRMLRFEYGIGFGRTYERNRETITPCSLVSNLAMFSVIYDTATKKWYFGK